MTTKETDGDSDSGTPDPRIEFYDDESLEYVLTPEMLDQFETTARTVTFECTSGDQITGRWWGIVLGDFLDELDLPDDATHLLVEARDGHKACLDIRSGFDALLAFRRLDDDDDDAGGLPRLLLSGLGGPRSLKWVKRIRPVQLAPGEQPEDYEPLPPSVEDDSVESA